MDGCIFALSMDSQLSDNEVEKLKREWEDLWEQDGERAPKLVILPDHSKIEKYEKIPGNYAYCRTFNGDSHLFTFQTFEEMKDFLMQDLFPED